MKTIALAGNPNCGKTTMFNALTGNNQYVGNWPGVTVEKKEGKLKSNKEIAVMDLPGIYSLSPYSLDEMVARDYLMNEKPDLIVNIIDGTNLERNLYLTTQLIETGIPVVVAINMMDIVKSKGDVIKTSALSKQLGCKVVEISALKKTGLNELVDEVTKSLNAIELNDLNIYDGSLNQSLNDIKNIISSKVSKDQLNWYAVKYYEGDEKALAVSSLSQNELDQINEIRENSENEFDDDAESIITNARYDYIAKVIKDSYKKSNKGLTTSDKIDRIVTNRWLALPIFAVVMYLVYYISISTVGGYATDWVNDVLFGEIIPPAIESFLNAIGCASWLSGLILDGIVAGVGAVLGFVPQMLVLFFFLAFLEECGYMARIAFIMDRIFRKFGLSGKSFIPMLIGTGCGVPAVMASRTIENEKDRRMTVMTTTFIPCSAKLPIIGLIAGALFNNAGWVATSAYFIGVAAIIISGIILKKTKLFAGDTTPFVMELPAYHMPTANSVLRSMGERGWSFIKKAGTIILVSTIFVWFTTYFGFVDGTFRMLEDSEIDYSILAAIGRCISWIFTPLGFGNWKATVASITGLVAKENVVGTFGILYHYAGELSENGDEIFKLIAGDFTIVSAFAFMVFNLLCAPCFAAMGAIKREMNNGRWTAIAIGYECLFAYVVALCVNQIGNLVVYGQFGLGTIVAFALVIGMVYLMVRKEPKAKDIKGAVKA
jgi:ferrous iron transport protein B